MDFVLAVKPLPKRLVRETAKNRIIVLLTEADEVAEQGLIHRDKAYMKKLQGTCFDCSKLNAEPPQDVCNTLSVPGYPDQCLDYNQPCTCFDCPINPPATTCGCSNGYPAVNTPSIGSGYWVGLQANNFYSNPINGGWLVAVACETGEIIGAFPVPNNKFGYGSGSILGVPVMVYPAGTIYGSGIKPYKKTSFPILGLISDDGDEIITTDFTMLTSGSPGCPTTNPNIFCQIGNSGKVTIQPQECLTKYGGQTQTGCTEWDSFKTQPVYDTNISYYADVGHIEGFPHDESQKVFLFEDSMGNRYCSVVTYAQQPSDALSLCGLTPWPDDVVAVYDDCVNCVTVPCQFLNNLTMGEFSLDFLGYNAASDKVGFFAIGPANPPYLDYTKNSPQVVNKEFWQTWWGWDGEIKQDPFLFSDGQNIQYIIPPIDKLLEECQCPEGSPSGGITFIEQFAGCCNESGQAENIASGQISLFAVKNFKPGLSCVPCRPKCTHPKCTCINFTDNLDITSSNFRQILGPIGDYGYVPCYTCNSNPVQNLFVNSSIWWSSQILDDNGTAPGSVYTGGGITPPGPDNSCDNILRTYGISYTMGNNSRPYLSAQCNSPCSNILEKLSEQKYVFNLNNFINCTGVDLNDPCLKIKYLPRIFFNGNLELVQGPYDDGYLLKYITVTLTDGRKIPLSKALCGCDPSATDYNDCLDNCWLRNIVGPFNSFETEACGPSISAFAPCTIPVNKKIDKIIGCSTPQNTEILKLIFEKAENKKCKIKENNCTDSFDVSEQTDPCSCCNQVIGTSLSKPKVTCDSGSSCFECCEGSGCIEGDCDLEGNNTIICNTGCGSGGTTGGSSGGVNLTDPNNNEDGDLL